MVTPLYWTRLRVDRIVRRVSRRGGWVPPALRVRPPAPVPLLVPSFGGPLDDEAGPPTLDPRLARLQVRAMLMANPATPCSTEEVAAVFGLRQGSVREARPASARRVGRALVAPFGHWLRALERGGLLPQWEADLPQGEPVACRAVRARSPAPRLEALGGPQPHRRSR